MEVRRSSKKQHTTVSFYTHLPPSINLDPEVLLLMNNDQEKQDEEYRNKEKEKEKMIKEYA
jgi:hypothetical protein